MDQAVSFSRLNVLNLSFRGLCGVGFPYCRRPYDELSLLTSTLVGPLVQHSRI